MKPPAFAYRDPETLDDALELLAGDESYTVVLAGGQSLVPLLNLRLAAPDTVLDINRIPGLDGIAVTDSSVTIGALARLSALEHDDELHAALPVLREAIRFVAHPQIRNRTTLGGTLCHADPTAELPAVALALEARMHLHSQSATRIVNAEGFFDSAFVTSKSSDELLVEVEFPLADGFDYTFLEVARRTHGDFPFVGLCFGVRLEDGAVADARMAAAGVAGRPVRLRGAEAALAGKALSDNLGDVLFAASEEVDPPADIHATADYRKGLLRTLIKRGAARLHEGAGR